MNCHGSIILNLFNGAVLLFDENEKKIVDRIINNKIFEYEDRNIINKLKKFNVIIPNDFDEQKEVLKRYDKSLENISQLHLTIFVTESCNFNCSYCFVDKRKLSCMRLDTMNNILKMIKRRVKEFKYNKISISWFGGEPLLAIEQIKYFLKLLKEFSIEKNINISNSLVSNGYFLSLNHFIELYNIGINIIQVTFDGSKERHNTFRKDKYNENTFDKIYNNLLKIKKTKLTNFVINIRCNYNKFNKDETDVNEFIEKFINDFGSDSRFSLELMPIIEYNKWGINNNEITTYIGNILYMIKKAEKYEIFKDNLLSMLSPKTMWCPIFNPHNLTLNSSGQIFTCDSVISNDDYKIGYIDENGIIIEDGNNIIENINHQLSISCQECERLPICFGSCHIIYKNYGKNACCCSNNEIVAFLDYFLAEIQT